MGQRLSTQDELSPMSGAVADHISPSPSPPAPKRPKSNEDGNDERDEERKSEERTSDVLLQMFRRSSGSLVSKFFGASSRSSQSESSNNELANIGMEVDDDPNSSASSSPVASPRTLAEMDKQPFRVPTFSRFRPTIPEMLSRSQSKARIISGNISGADSSLDSSSDDDDDIAVDSDELEVNDWLDEPEEPEDAVLSPKLSKPRRESSFSSVTSHSHMNQSSNSLTGHPAAGRNSVSSSSHSLTALTAWLSSPEEPDDEDEDYEPVLSQFLQDNMPVYEIMKQVQLFRNLSQKQQEQVVRALKPAKFQDGEVIVQQGTRGSRFYMIAKGSAVITKTVEGSPDQERMITHLHAGHYFGELALIYDDPRTATVRAVGDVELLYLTQEDFQRIGQVHLSLMLQQVPLLARLNARDQDIVLSRLKPANFSDGEYIVRQGEEGTRFYMITRGEAVVTENATQTTTASDGTTSTTTYEKELTRLYEGHVFGEMSLIYKEPRTASVRAIGQVKCLYLSKEDFDKCLLSDHFQRFIQEAYVEKATRRAMRLRLQQQRLANSSVSSGSGREDDPNSSMNLDPNASGVFPPPVPSSPAKATETRKLVKQRLKNGQKVVNKYVIKGDLGKGTFGRVKLCQSEEDGKLYAVKIMHRTFVQRMAGKEDQFQDVLRREVAIMKKLNHRNVVKLVEVIDDPSSQKMYLVQEYVQHNLMDEVTRTNGLNEEVARKYMRDLLSGLHYLHFHKVIHRDIKPENILVSDEGVAKIADFGTARMIMNETETLSGAKGTPAFMAPEMFDIDATYQGPAVDIWSLGATLYMMVIGRPPWLADNEIVLAERVQREELKFPKDIERTMEPHLKNLLQRMLTKDPRLRITLSDCFTHDWVTKEGSDPLGLAENQGKHFTVSIDESERAIQNIPERIDQNLSESLAKAHLMVKTRQQQGGVMRTNSAHSLTRGGSGQLETRIPTAGSTTSSTSSASSISTPSRASTEEVSRIISAWRHHKRVQLMHGHKDLSARSRELLLDQKRMAFSAERAKVTEIILPATGPTSRSRHASVTSSSGMHQSSASLVSLPSAPGSPGRRQSTPMIRGVRSNSVENSTLTKKRSTGKIPQFKDSGNLEGFGRTSFTSVSRLSDFSATALDDSADRESLSSSSETGSNHAASARELAPDAELVKRSLSRKKDFLMVTSEVFRNEDGDYQSRKILFQARDHDFSVASRAPAHSSSGRELGRVSSSQTGKSVTSSSRKSLGSSSINSMNSSISSSSAASAGAKSASGDDFDMGDIDCVQVTDVDDDEEDDEAPRRRGSESSEDSVYSDVEADVDVDATFNDLIGAPNHLEIVADDEELAPDGPTHASSFTNLLEPDKPQIVQVYVSSKIRENLTLRIRSGYAEAKGARAYMEDKTLGMTDCDLSSYDSSVASTYASLAYFAVYDGHNGDDTAAFLHRELHHRFFNQPEFIDAPLKAIPIACDQLDFEILEMQNRSVLPKRKRTFGNEVAWQNMADHTHSDDDDEDEDHEDVHVADDDEDLCPEDVKCHLQPISFSGAVTVFAILAKRKRRRVEADNHHSDEPKENEPAQSEAGESGAQIESEDEPTVLYFANIGDCRAVLSTGDGVAVELTKDHKASLPEEKTRIESSGGFVHNGRLDGILAISRGFGDLAHKEEGHLIVTPDVYEREVAPEDEFLLLASDGLFDVLSSQQVVNFIRRKLRMHGDVQLAAQELVLKAQQYFAHDNISVVIVALNQVANVLS